MSSLSKDRERQLRQREPLILLGMHRSGTSLVTRLLVELGIHMGSWLSRDAEAVHFQRINRRIYGAADSTWGDVGALLQAMHSDAFVSQQAEVARRALFRANWLRGPKSEIAKFFGPDLWPKVTCGEPVRWGWKDPRTTLVFPIWLRLFPHARWVHVVRNGIDVAISIHRRSLKQRRKLRNRLLAVDFSPETVDFDYSFRLWETYVSYVLEQQHLLPSQRLLVVRYEDLLAEPATSLRTIAEFAGHPVEEDRLKSACRRIDQSRQDNRPYALAYRDQIPVLAGSPLMQELGYSYDVGSAGEARGR